MDATRKNCETFEFSGEEDNVPDHVHKNLLENVKQIHGKPKITPATRTEPAAVVSEFNIGSKKKTKSGKSTFREADLIHSIKKKKPRIAQKLEATKKTKTLSKPLETVYEKRVERETGYQNVKKRLDEWTDIVSSNRVADQLVFPLKNKEIEIYDHTDADPFSSFSKLTPLEQAFKEVLSTSETSKKEEKKLEQSKFRVSLKEMMEKRKMFAKVKAQASYQIAKSRRQNKIKSKKYHRILRRERTKQQLKDFELLQKTDPEAALKQLEQLEKSRAQERATLRHRNTGKWARNQLIRAKFNKESRQALSEQLAKNRELTDKMVVASSDSDSDEDEISSSVPPLADSNEPWLGGSSYKEFVDSYKEWKESKNRLDNRSKSNQESFEVDEITPSVDSSDTSEGESRLEGVSQSSTKENEADGEKSKFLSIPMKDTKEIYNSSGVWTVTVTSDLEESIPKDEESKKTNVSEMFDSLENKLEHKFKKRLREVQEAEAIPTQKKRVKSQNKGSNKRQKFAENDVTPALQTKPIPDDNVPEPVETTLENEIPDFMATEDDAIDDAETDCERQHRMTISEAFADEDVVAEFQEEKQKKEKDDEPKIIDPSLPGWGSWVDASNLHKTETKESNRRRGNKRLRFKIPKAPPRRDENKGFVIMKEDKNDKFKEHMVSEVPHPFTKVEDFEAVIRTPIGRTWLPETAHQQLIAPQIVTKLGTVIEPMDEGELVRREN